MELVNPNVAAFEKLVSRLDELNRSFSTRLDDIAFDPTMAELRPSLLQARKLVALLLTVSKQSSGLMMDLKKGIADLIASTEKIEPVHSSPLHESICRNHLLTSPSVRPVDDWVQRAQA